MKYRKTKRYIRFNNGIEIQIPVGWHFADKVTIDGIVSDKLSTED